MRARCALKDSLSPHRIYLTHTTQHPHSTEQLAITYHHYHNNNHHHHQNYVFASIKQGARWQRGTDASINGRLWDELAAARSVVLGATDGPRGHRRHDRRGVRAGPRAAQGYVVWRCTPMFLADSVCVCAEYFNHAEKARAPQGERYVGQSMADEMDKRT